jgi:N utilization substance protein B
MTRRSRAREVAVQLLFQRDYNANLDRDRVEAFIRQRVHDADLEAFCVSLYDGVVERITEIDDHLARAAENWRLPRMAGVDRSVLRLGAFELLFAPETPAEVALNEAIELARRFGSAESPAFVNGILDRLRKDASTPETT